MPQMRPRRLGFIGRGAISPFELFRPSTLAAMIADLDDAELNDRVELGEIGKAFRDQCACYLIQAVGDVDATRMVKEAI